MTAFIRSEFSVIRYTELRNKNIRILHLLYKGAFVAAFKRPVDSPKNFMEFLIKNFTVEEYFDEKNQWLFPLNILKAKGYREKNIHLARYRLT